MKLNLYTVKRADKIDYNEWEAFVVAAMTAEGARRHIIEGPCAPWGDPEIVYDGVQGEWGEPELIGQSIVSNKKPAFIVLGSYNAG